MVSISFPVSLSGSLWQIGLPVAVVAISALVLVTAVRSRDKPEPTSRSFAVFAVLVWLKLAGEAAFGDRRPVFERQWKGSAALLLALAGAIHLWQRYRWRDPDPRDPAPAPGDTATRSTSPSSEAWLVTMPALGPDVAEATVTCWLKQVGDRVEAGEPLVEISTDKAETEIPAETAGNLFEIRVPAGGTAAAGSTIAVIEPSTDRRQGTQHA